MNDETNDRTSRRRVLAGGMAVLAAGAVGRAAVATAAQKLEKSAVQYQDTPKDGQKCSNCVNFVAPNACKIVAGEISPNGYCVAFAPKAT